MVVHKVNKVCNKTVVNVKVMGKLLLIWETIGNETAHLLVYRLAYIGSCGFSNNYYLVSLHINILEVML